MSFSQPLFRAGGLLIKRLLHPHAPPARSTQARSPVGKICAPLVLSDGDNVLSAFPSQTTSRLEASGTAFMNI